MQEVTLLRMIGEVLRALFVLLVILAAAVGAAYAVAYTREWRKRKHRSQVDDAASSISLAKRAALRDRELNEEPNRRATFDASYRAVVSSKQPFVHARERTSSERTICLLTYGTRGDVEPLVALAIALRKLGARVIVCAPACYASVVSGAEGVSFASCGVDEVDQSSEMFAMESFSNIIPEFSKLFLHCLPPCTSAAQTLAPTLSSQDPWSRASVSLSHAKCMCRAGQPTLRRQTTRQPASRRLSAPIATFSGDGSTGYATIAERFRS